MSEIFDFPAIQESANTIAQEVLAANMESKKYTPGKVPEWIETITTQCIERLRELSPNFKYVVSCIIVQKLGAGIHYDCVTHWDPKTDGSTTARFENDSMALHYKIHYDYFLKTFRQQQILSQKLLPDYNVSYNIHQVVEFSNKLQQYSSSCPECKLAKLHRSSFLGHLSAVENSTWC
eukprot:gene6108-12367_t